MPGEDAIVLPSARYSIGDDKRLLIRAPESGNGLWLTARQTLDLGRFLIGTQDLWRDHVQE